MRIHPTCPSCSCQVDHHLSLDIHPPQEEICLLNKEIQRTEVALQRLQQKRSALLGRINILQGSTRNIPPEILSCIFRYARHSPPVKSPGKFPSHHCLPDTFPPVLNLAAVCSTWRQVAISTPDLWTTVSVHVQRGTIYKNVAMVKIFLDNVKTYPMSLKLTFQFDEEYDVPEVEEQAIFSLVNECAGKVGVLQLESMPECWLYSIKWQNFDMLTDLRLYWDVDCDPLDDILSLPKNLRNISIRYLQWRILPQYLANITVLALDRIQLENWMSNLSQCTSLLSLSISRVETPWINQASGFTENVTLAHLEALEVELDRNEWSNLFLRKFQFPALKRLRWTGLCDPLPWAAAADFFGNLPTTVANLEVVLKSCWGTPCDAISLPLLRMLHHFAGIKTLLVEVIPSDDGARGYHALASMTWVEGILDALRRRHDGSDEDLLPSLSVLGLQIKKDTEPYYGGGMRMPQIPVLCKMLVDMLEVRAEMGLKEFKFVWDWAIVFTPADREALRGLVTNGLRLDVVQHSQQIELESLLAPSDGPRQGRFTSRFL